MKWTHQHHSATEVLEDKEQGEREGTAQAQTDRHCMEYKQQHTVKVITDTEGKVETGAEEHKWQEQNGKMSKSEPVDRDSTGPLGPRDGCSLRFSCMDARWMLREANRFEQEDRIGEYEEPWYLTQSRKRQAADPPVHEQTPWPDTGPSTFRAPYIQ